MASEVDATRYIAYLYQPLSQHYRLQVEQVLQAGIS
jgi:hypothetical protein